MKRWSHKGHRTREEMMDSKRAQDDFCPTPAWLENRGLTKEALRAAVNELGIEILGALCACAEPAPMRARFCSLAARKFTYPMYAELCYFMELCSEQLDSQSLRCGMDPEGGYAGVLRIAVDDKDSVERHENLVTKFACTLCRHSFATKAALQVHAERHQWVSGDKECKRIRKGGQTSTRNVCGKRINVSTKPKKRVRTRAAERPYRCKYCVKTFSYQPNLIRHMCICVGDKPYACTVCGKGFSWPSHCQLHMRMHTGERPYMCTICYKGFSRSSNCQIHMQTHKGERPYTCTVCGKGFSRSSNCQTHMRTHTGERPYNCSVCARTFSYQSALRNHLRTHTGEKPYICNVCGKGFSQLPTCQRHMRLHVGENCKDSI
uniref:zinc finger protein 664-like isoform X2 n=1 Tax=Myxine glutinosa TaxID=7769 RepID=UPI00358FAEBB